jgi:hypothetical protein
LIFFAEKPQSITLNPVYFQSALGSLMPSGVWLFSNKAATIRARASSALWRIFSRIASVPSFGYYGKLPREGSEITAGFEVENCDIWVANHHYTEDDVLKNTIIISAKEDCDKKHFTIGILI